MSVKILVGDCRQVLASIDPESVHCVVTSPPYFGLRDYGTGTWEGGDPACGHVVGEMRRGLGLASSQVSVRGGGHKAAEVADIKARAVCPHCDARRVDQQIGQEDTPAEYVEQIVAVMREVRRVLRDDGTLWLNLGDTYASVGGPKQTAHTGKQFKTRARGKDVISKSKRMPRGAGNRWGGGNVFGADGIKAKDLIGIPWMVAFALRADGWYLRQEIIWAKPNPMPESVTDRCTKAHEHIFLLTKSERYYYDAAAIAEPSIYADSGRSSAGPDDLDPDRKRNDRTVGASFRAITEKRNKRSVWTVATRPFGEAHFATFPPALILPCILAGSPEGGTVLDPFGGAGTTGLVADRNHRDAVLVELNQEYADIARRRIMAEAGMFAEVGT